MGDATAMILAAGRGERMRPLSDATPKPLLVAGGKPLVVHQIEALARAGHRDIAINASHLAGRLVDALADGRALGVRLHWSIEPEPLETAGGLATAFPLFAPVPIVVVSGDIWTDYDYAALAPRIAAIAGPADPARAHLVMVPNPPWHPGGDFALESDAGRDGGVCRVGLRRTGPLTDGCSNLTYGNIGLYDSALFDDLPRGVKLKLLPLYREWIGAGIVTGERYDGRWANIGTPEDLAGLDAALAGRA
jgi:MurNAc alpha-1-phosphate uridylyltransferase